MSTTIRLKRTDIAGQVPSATDLVAGELCVNTADGHIFALVAGSIQKVGSIDFISGSPLDGVKYAMQDGAWVVDETAIADVTGLQTELDNKASSSDLDFRFSYKSRHKPFSLSC